MKLLKKRGSPRCPNGKSDLAYWHKTLYIYIPSSAFLGLVFIDFCFRIKLRDDTFTQRKRKIPLDIGLAIDLFGIGIE